MDQELLSFIKHICVIAVSAAAAVYIGALHYKTIIRIDEIYKKLKSKEEDS